MSGRESRRWTGRSRYGWGEGRCARQAEGAMGYNSKGGAAGVVVMKKRVMVVVDGTTRAKHAMMWALTHVANKEDVLTLLHVVVPPNHGRRAVLRKSLQLASSLGTFCKACRPEVEVEALVIQGPKLITVLSQVKKLDASILVLSQMKNRPLVCCCLFRSRREDFVEECIDKAECLTLAVRKQGKGLGGYLISSRWQKNFWLLA